MTTCGTTRGISTTSLNFCNSYFQNGLKTTFLDSFLEIRELFCGNSPWYHIIMQNFEVVVQSVLEIKTVKEKKVNSKKGLRLIIILYFIPTNNALNINNNYETLYR